MKSYTNSSGKKQIFYNEETGEIISLMANEQIVLRTKKEVKRNNDVKYWGGFEKMQERFIKCKIEPIRVIIKILKTNLGALRTLNYISTYLQPKTNLVVTESGKRYTIINIANDLGVSRQQITKDIECLRDKGMLDIITFNNSKYICVNPYIYNNGEEMAKKVLDLFSKKKKFFYEAK